MAFTHSSCQGNMPAVRFRCFSGITINDILNSVVLLLEFVNWYSQYSQMGPLPHFFLLP